MEGCDCGAVAPLTSRNLDDLRAHGRPEETRTLDEGKGICHERLERCCSVDRGHVWGSAHGNSSPFGLLPLDRRSDTQVSGSVKPRRRSVSVS